MWSKHIYVHELLLVFGDVCFCISWRSRKLIVPIRFFWCVIFYSAIGCAPRYLFSHERFIPIEKIIDFAHFLSFLLERKEIYCCVRAIRSINIRLIMTADIWQLIPIGRRPMGDESTPCALCMLRAASLALFAIGSKRERTFQRNKIELQVSDFIFLHAEISIQTATTENFHYQMKCMEFFIVLIVFV